MSEDSGLPRRAGRRTGVFVAVAVAVAAAAIVIGLSGGRAHRHATTTPATTTSTQSTSTHAVATSAPPSTTGPAPAGPPAQPPPTIEQFGVNVNGLFNDRTFTPDQIDAQLTALRATGATIARSDTLWEFIEPQPPVGDVHHYDWSFDDTIAESLAAHGLKWLPIIDYSAPWAQVAPGQLHSPPNDGAYATFASALASRYGPDGEFWRSHPGLPGRPVDIYEIWNEPDSGVFWSPHPDPQQYVDLYLRARAGVTSVDPHARVIVGGITGVAKFVGGMLAARPDLKGHLDGVAVHAYRRTPDEILARVRTDRAELSTLGLGSVPLYLTEFGWSTMPPAPHFWLPGRLRPRYIADTIELLAHAGCGLAATILYTWVTPERDPLLGDDWFGINSTSVRAPTADVAAFTAALSAIGNSVPVVDSCAAP